ncbi:hypothetical protein GCM10027579_19680 [Calidifontibacter terrae]
MTRRFAGIVIGSQSLVLFFGALVAYSLAKSSGDGSHTAYLWAGSVLAVLCVVAAGSMRRSWGITLGWIIEVLTLAATAIVGMMLVVGLVFGALWVTALVQGAKMDRLTREFAAGDGANQPTA